MADLRRVSIVAVVLLVILRLSIGWQLLYEGLWKYDTLSTPTPWTAEGYLKNSVGPLRNTFRDMTGDPDDTNWLSYEKVSAKWDDWAKRLVDYYDLNEDQQARLNELLDGPAEIAVPLPLLPDGVSINDDGDLVIASMTDPKKKYRLPRVEIEGQELKTLEWDDGNGRLSLNQEAMFLPYERDQFIEILRKRQTQVIEAMDAAVADLTKMKYSPRIAEGEENTPVAALRPTKIGKEATSDKNPDELQKKYNARRDEYTDLRQTAEQYQAFIEAVDEVSKLGAQLSYRKQLRGMLQGDGARRTFLINEDEPEESIYRLQRGDNEIYRNRLRRYLDKASEARMSHNYDHLSYDWSQIQELKGNLVNPVKDLDKNLKADAYQSVVPRGKIASRGMMPDEVGGMRTIDLMTIWSLIILGVLLLFGLATRVAAIGAAVMLFSFYMAFPPWPGVPEIPGPEHAFIINKNLIEVIALLAIAALPTGSWFGVDALFNALWQKRKRGEKVPRKTKKTKTKTADASAKAKKPKKA